MFVRCKIIDSRINGPTPPSKSTTSHSFSRYNYFLNTLDNSLSNEEASVDTLKSHYNDLVSFVRNLSVEEKQEIQRDNKALCSCQAAM
ncbi:unnamed protein product [Effrenium voratum]|uniref:Uncharacterized protein n=1 Tax=Effrenium voratum TaxID=2562239 RepID=A0AA36JQD8_9DINO|nr:unnamed protein product [Effrenium voratum]CAJ1410470.1 unnamed protein product [Effrenium voratum]CAJ1414725.1 unnamed protein product [Effrenium voratum]CAJ1419396.1 unnamed protein product [Effrenium voratum]